MGRQGYMKIQKFLIYHCFSGSVIILTLTLSLTFVSPVCALLTDQSLTGTYYTGKSSVAAGIEKSQPFGNAFTRQMTFAGVLDLSPMVLLGSGFFGLTWLIRQRWKR